MDATSQTTVQANGRPDLAWHHLVRSGASGGSLEKQLAALDLDAASRSRFRADVIHVAIETADAGLGCG